MSAPLDDPRFRRPVQRQRPHEVAEIARLATAPFHCMALDGAALLT
jgi:hypothetical protein